MEGQTLGRYRLLEEIGQGGMSVVYRGVDTTLDREVAVKILHPHLSRKASSRNRFAREAKAVARLHHDNILEIYDFSGDEARDAYIVTELVRGETLAEYLEREIPLPAEVGAMIVAEISDAVAHAHDLGVIHRDIKTENVMIREDGVLKLMDFGIARLKEEVAATMTGLRMGTPHYMSPEQAAGTTRHIDERADVFALGVLLYRLTAGSYPFDGPNPAVILARIIEGRFTDPAEANPAVGRKLCRIISRALSVDQNLRYANASEFRQALQGVLDEAGFGPTRAELRRYFKDPERYSDLLVTRLVKRYSQLGRTALEDGSIPAALELFNRVLVLDPSNAAVKQTLRRLGRKRRVGQVAAGIAVTVFVLTAGGAGVRAYLHSVENRPTPSPEDTPTQLVQISPTIADTASPEPSPEASPVKTTPPRTRTPVVITTTAAVDVTQPTTAPTTLVAQADTPTPTPKPPLGPSEGMGGLRLQMREMGNVFLNEKGYGDTFTFKLGGRFEELPPGVYQLRVVPVQAQCETLEEKITIVEGEIHTLARGLSGCPTHILVSGIPAADLAGAELRLDGKPVGKFAGSESGIFEVGPIETRSGQHKIEVVRSGSITFENLIDVPTVSLDSEPHRVLVPALEPK